MRKRCVFIALILVALAGIMVFFYCGRQKVHYVTGINNMDHYYILGSAFVLDLVVAALMPAIISIDKI